MRSALLASALVVTAVVSAYGADASAIEAAAAGWTQAAVKQDTEGLKRFLADDLQYAHAGGNTQNKAEYIAAVMKGPSHYESFTFSDVTVRFYGPSAAVLTGFVDVKMPGQHAFRVRTLQVYTLNGGQWQMAAHQSTRLNSPRR